MALSNGPNLGLLVNGTKGEEHYDALMAMWRGLDTLVQPKILDKDLTAPPGSPTDGATYIVGASATGAWAGHDKSIARWSAIPAAWEFYPPKNGWLVYAVDESVNYQYNGTNWIVLATGGTGDVTGPASSVADRVVTFNGTTGKVIKDSGLAITTSTTLAGNSNTNIPTEAAVKAYVDSKPTGSGDVTGPASSVVDNLASFNATTGKVIKDSGLAVTTSTTLAGNSNTNIPTEAAVKAYVDSRPTGTGDVAGPASAVVDHFATFNATSGKVIKDSGLSLTTSTTLAGNSNTNIPTEAAVKAYVDAKPAGDVTGPSSSVTDRIVTFNGTTGKVIKDSGISVTTSTALAGNADSNIPTEKAVKSYVDAALSNNGDTYDLPIAASDETSALTTGTGKITLRAPRAFRLFAVRASLNTAQTSGALVTVNVKVNGTSVFSTKITIDNGEKTSATAATPPVLTGSAILIADDSEITIDVDQIGDGTAKGLKVNLIGYLAIANGISTVSTLTNSSGTVNVDCLLGDYFTLTLGANVTNLTFSNLPGAGRGISLMIQITQDPATPRTFAWPSSFKWPGGSAPTISSAVNKVDVLGITSFDNGTTWRATLNKDFA
jgi:hypothetical protein